MARATYETPHLRAWRMHRLLTTKQLADAAQMNEKTIYRLERPGQQANELTVHKLANALGIDFQKLLEELPASRRE